jgi:NAD(P)-dependent dehydrogenase (short-subunit alcohol dehydrogenase family)
MARIFITGSSDRIGLMEARMLVSEGHQVVPHGRNRQRADEALSKAPAALNICSSELQY